MATKVKPTRLQVTGTPHAGDVPLYVDGDSFQWGNVSFSEGRFLSLWDCTTGQPISFPEATPYTYKTGDYFIVETVSSATPPVNYRPDGSTYTGTASSTTESDEVLKGDFYVYDGTVWLLASNHGKTVSFANLAGQPTDNANLATALNAKADATDLNTKTFYLSSTSDLTTAQDAYDYYTAGKNPIVVYNNQAYILMSTSASAINFVAALPRVGNVIPGTTTERTSVVLFTLSSGTVTAITQTSYNVNVLNANTDYATPYTPQYDGSPATKKYVDDHGVPSGGTDGQVLSKVSGSVAWANPTGGAEIEYKTQAEYTALLPGAESDDKHYFIYTPVVPPTPIGRPTITGLSYDNKSFYNGGQETDVQGIFLSPDGTKMYLSGESTHKIHQYTLGTARDLSTATYDNKYKITTEGGGGAPSDLYMSDDGTTLYLSTFQQKMIYRYTLSTARDISTATYDNVSSFTANNEMPSFCFGDDGNYLYMCTQTNITRYELNTPYDITSNTGTTQTLAKNYVIGYGLTLNEQGTQLFYLDRDYINGISMFKIYNLGTAWDLTTATFYDSVQFNGDWMALFIGDSGNKAYLGKYWEGGSYFRTVYQYSTTTS